MVRSSVPVAPVLDILGKFIGSRPAGAWSPSSTSASAGPASSRVPGEQHGVGQLHHRTEFERPSAQHHDHQRLAEHRQLTQEFELTGG